MTTTDAHLCTGCGRSAQSRRSGFGGFLCHTRLFSSSAHAVALLRAVPATAHHTRAQLPSRSMACQRLSRRAQGAAARFRRCMTRATGTLETFS